MSPATARFARVTRVNEGTKALVAASLRVNLLALDAMVQGRRAGGSLRGFDEVSSQMRRWSLELVGALEAVRALNSGVLSLVSLVEKEERALSLLAGAAHCHPGPSISAAMERQLTLRDVGTERLRRARRHLVDALDDLNQLGLMASVLSRAAMIEAASGDSDQRRQLGAVSQEFHHNAEEVMRLLKELLRGAREGS